MSGKVWQRCLDRKISAFRDQTVYVPPEFHLRHTKDVSQPVETIGKKVAILFADDYCTSHEYLTNDLKRWFREKTMEAESVPWEIEDGFGQRSRVIAWRIL